MSEFNEGDLVEAVKGESVVRGRVKIGNRDNGTEGYKYLGDSGAIKEVYVHDGWTVTVIEEAARPTGVYADRQGDLWIMDREGKWWDFTNGLVGEPTSPNPEYWAPFTRLEPVKATAKRVLDAIRRVAEERAGNPWNASVTINAVATEFGVTE